MSGDRATYLDSSALVKLIVAEPETVALRAYLRGRQRLVSSALARIEVARAGAGGGSAMLAKAHELFRQVAVLRIGDGVLNTAGSLPPATLRSLDAIHLATASLLHSSLGAVVTYDARMADAALVLGMDVRSPGRP
ncbi:MAG: type II toxin-antitoxin system VapC family toxin [Thermaerobacter sp.]|nr:type II toxin-antitoxin system VapC family toxin [Thermaerobacter sp.]